MKSRALTWLFAVLALCPFSSVKNGFADQKKLLIGAVLPLTGDYAPFGADVRLGLQAFQDQHSNELSIIFEDGGTLDPARTVSIVKKVIEQDKVDALAVVSADDALPVVPLVSQRRVPLLIVWDSHSDIIASSPYIFSSGFDTKSAGKQLAEFAVKQGFRTASLVSDPSPYTELTSAAFRESFSSPMGARIVLNEQISSFDSDLRSLVPRILELKSDVVYVNLATMAGISSFLRRLSEQGYKGAILSGELLAGELIAGAANVPLLDKIFVSWVQSPFLDQVRGHLKKRGITPQVDASVCAVGYDAVNVMAEAYRKNPADLQKGLLAILGEDRTLNRPFGVKSARELQSTAAGRLEK